MATRVKVSVPTYYYQFDQQGVAFNMWYLAFIEQARNAYLAAQGYSLEDLLASGHDIQLVHVELDWSAALRYGDPLEVEVSPGHAGTTSFSIRQVLSVHEHECCVAVVFYVIIDAAANSKAALPEGLRTALAR